MTLEEAIEILTFQVRIYNQIHQLDIIDALGLGIEALTWRKLMEDDYGSWCGPLLPGETEV